jgi:hypothetical protein
VPPCFLFLGRSFELFSQLGQIVEQQDQIVNERALKRFANEIVAVIEELGMKRVE